MVKKWPIMAKNSIFTQMGVNGVIIALHGLLSVDIIATAPSDNIFVNNSGDGIKGLPICRHKFGQMAKNLIFLQMAGKWGGNGIN